MRLLPHCQEIKTEENKKRQIGETPLKGGGGMAAGKTGNRPRTNWE